jgi:hypothetical protein
MAPAGRVAWRGVAWRAETARIAGAAVIGAVIGWAISWDLDWSGHVDLGALGAADRWADLAIATWNARLNYGPGWDGPLLDAYGIAPDTERTRYYRLLGRCP